MDLIKELRQHKKLVEDNTPCYMHFEISCNGNDIAIELSIQCGWDYLLDENKCWNACDYETNKTSAENYVRNFDYRKYIQGTKDK